MTLAKMDKCTVTRSVGSTEAQNNFGQVLDDATRNHACYIIERRGAPQAILISCQDFARILQNAEERRAMLRIIRQMMPEHSIGRVIQAPAPNTNRRPSRERP